MRSLLIVVDMQNDFIEGTLGTKEAQSIIPNVMDEIDKYEKKNIFVTRDTHTEAYLNTQEGKYLPVSHCVKNTWGWEIKGEIADVLEGAIIFDKPTFGSTELVNTIFELSKKEEIEIELIGLCTDICVVSNALLLKATMPEVTIKVNKQCCAGVTPKSHEAALLTMEMCQIQVI